ncbi:hypothetical protein [Sinomonas mesophila]|uniref:hypothetical protein n=1 Tax=Sinomonas mesophila TaxID=1531955 RepID=UPI0009856B3D|nr:hypothetical protein [Sinomonas mesophila]
MASRTEQRWDRRALRFALMFPALLGAGFALAAFTFRGRVPEPVAWLWDADGGRAFVSFAGYLAGGAGLVAIAGALACLPGALLTRPPIARRITMGGGVGFALFLTTVLAAGLMGQVGVADARESRPDPIVLAMGSGAALALAVVMMLAFKPDEQWSPKDEAALLAELEPERARSTFGYWAHARSSVFVMLGVLVVPVSLLLVLISAWLSALLALVGLVAAGSLMLHVSVSPERVRLRAGGLVPVLSFAPERVLRASSRDVAAREFGGWGYRRRGADISVLVASGRAVQVVLDGGRRCTFSGRDAETSQRVVEVLRAASGA